MALRSRLALFFVGIVVVPLLAVGVLVGTIVPSQIAARRVQRLHVAATAIDAIRSERLDRAARDVQRIARAIGAIPAGLRAGRLAAARKETGLDFLSVGSVHVMRPGAGDTPAITASAPLSGGQTLRGGWLIDDSLAARYATAAGAGVRFLVNGSTVASAGPLARTGGSLRLPAETYTVLLTVPADASAGNMVLALAGIGITGLLLACGIGFALARTIARPLGDLAHGANAIAGGDYTHRVQGAGRDEVGQLGRAFNTMASSVESYVRELKGSRDELRNTLHRLGATLGSTCSVDDMLVAVLDASASALGATTGSVFRFTRDGTLGVDATIGMEAAQATREAAAQAVRERRPVLAAAMSGEDPFDRTVAAAPLFRGDVVVGAIAIASAASPEPFGEQDLQTLASFATQASIAIDNVLLRGEAERMALTDPLTGVPNRRALGRSLDKELERARRYHRPVSVVMCDLDHFKSVNDRYGHLDGDRVLIEAARRIGTVIRCDVDVLARFGGEEFVVILPETDGAGAVVVAEKICRAMRSADFPAGDGIRLTVSAGVASVLGDGPTTDELLHAADLALYRAKQEGRDRVVSHLPEDAKVSVGGWV